MVSEVLKKLGDFKYNNSKEEEPFGLDAKNIEKRKMVTFDHGIKYLGEWNKITELKEGKGLQIWPDGSQYEGFWKRNMANGRGRLVHSDGDVYIGDWVDDKAHGYGVYLHYDGAKYEGYWVNDKQCGKGKETWTDGAVFEGTYQDGMK